MASNYPDRPLIPTCDICDAYEDKANVVQLSFQDFGGCEYFSGPAVTLRTFNDNRDVKAALSQAGGGAVLIVDNAADMTCALVGGNLASMAVQNGWAGIVVNGCIRDRHELRHEKIAIKALGIFPRKAYPNKASEKDIALTIGNVIIKPGMWVTGDLDGVVVTDKEPKLQ